MSTQGVLLCEFHDLQTLLGGRTVRPEVDPTQGGIGIVTLIRAPIVEGVPPELTIESGVVHTSPMTLEKAERLSP